MYVEDQQYCSHSRRSKVLRTPLLRYLKCGRFFGLYFGARISCYMAHANTTFPNKLTPLQMSACLHAFMSLLQTTLFSAGQISTHHRHFSLKTGPSGPLEFEILFILTVSIYKHIHIYIHIYTHQCMFVCM